MEAVRIALRGLTGSSEMTAEAMEAVGTEPLLAGTVLDRHCFQAGGLVLVCVESAWLLLCAPLRLGSSCVHLCEGLHGGLAQLGVLKQCTHRRSSVCQLWPLLLACPNGRFQPNRTRRQPMANCGHVGTCCLL